MNTAAWKKELAAGAFDGELRGLYDAPAGEQVSRRLALLDAFEARFGTHEAVVVSAPGRTELAGNHTDHQRGRVLCAAVTLDALAVASPRPDGRVRIVSQGFGEVSLALDSLAPLKAETGTTAALVRGVARGFRDAGLSCGGFDACVTSAVPAGGGLSSSAAFEILTGALFSALYNGGAASPLLLARIGQRAENEYFGKPSGLMDQAASAFGGIRLIDFADPLLPEVVSIPFSFRDHGYILCAVDTGTSHADLTEDYASIPREMGQAARVFGQDYLRYVNYDVFQSPEGQARLRQAVSPRAADRARHFFGENERVLRMADCLRQGDAEGYRRLMLESGESSRRLLQNIVPASHPGEQGLTLALDRCAAALGDRGAWRVHGGGFAGCVQCMVPAAEWDGFREAMAGYYGPAACRALVIRPAGAHRLGEGL